MHRAYFRCEPTFDEATSWAEFDAALLDAPVAGADPALAAMLERHARDLVAGLPTTSVADQVRALLAKDLAGGVPEASGAAKKLGLSERSLHRKLRDERHSYQAIVDGVRRHLAERHLAERRLPITEIAFLLGFTEASSFHRAFRRWTGRTPAAYRDALGA
jgi:AraC-like DNA-binding protein